jgi:hypothetical protein
MRGRTLSPSRGRLRPALPPPAAFLPVPLPLATAFPPDSLSAALAAAPSSFAFLACLKTSISCFCLARPAGSNLSRRDGGTQSSQLRRAGELRGGGGQHGCLWRPAPPMPQESGDDARGLPALIVDVVERAAELLLAKIALVVVDLEDLCRQQAWMSDPRGQQVNARLCECGGLRVRGARGRAGSPRGGGGEGRALAS